MEEEIKGRALSSDGGSFGCAFPRPFFEVRCHGFGCGLLLLAPLLHHFLSQSLSSRSLSLSPPPPSLALGTTS